MKWLKRVFDFYLDASIHVALAVFSLVQISGLVLEVSIDPHCSCFIFFATIACYNFVKYGVEAEKYILVASEYHKGIQVFSLLSLGVALYNCYFLNFEVWIGIACLLLLTALYAIPVMPKNKNLRSWGGLKIFVVAMVWAGVTVFLPVLSSEMALSWDVYIEALQRFVLVFILLIPFEIRDLKYDQPDLRTLPQQFGVTKTKIFGSFAVLLFFFLTFLKDGISSNELILKGLLFLSLGVVMYFTKRNQSKYFASFWVEGIPIIWWGLFTALQNAKPYFATSLSF